MTTPPPSNDDGQLPTVDGGKPPDQNGSGLDDLLNDKAVRVVAVVLAGVLAVVMLGAAATATVKTAGSMFGQRNHHGRMMPQGGLEDGPGGMLGRRGQGRGQGGGQGGQDTTPSPDDDQDTVPGMPGMPNMPGLGGRNLNDLLGSALPGLQHGDVVLQNAAGGASTKRFVKGTVTAVTGTTVTVKATDGYTAKFVVTATTIIRVKEQTGNVGSLKAGSSVLAIGTVSGKSVSAELISIG